MNISTKQKILEAQKQQSICWKCSNCYGGCSWSRSYIPVDGWEAEQRNIEGHDKKAEKILISYRVDSCPEFAEDKRK